ncbi:MAG: SMP-30/gluconolactonase/LRE family protein [Planctomycetia bacterium]|nr:SMP-30/gluconolactonase/LRE family protein [Planctomycetia bacterium]
MSRTTLAVGCGLLGIGLLLASGDAEQPTGVYQAEAVAASPRLTASGMAWWKDRLIIADRGNKRLLAFTPPDRFETFKELQNPVGVAVDPAGNLIVTEKDVINHVLRIKPDGSLEELAAEGVATPHFVTVHKGGTIYWSGFPDGSTRSLTPRGKPVVHEARIGHTYGIALSPKQDTLFVTSKLPDPGRRAVWRIPVDCEGKLGKGEEFFKVQDLQPKIDKLPPAKDGGASLLGWLGRLQGLAIDAQGNFYVAGSESHTSGEAVAVISPDGKQVRAMILGVPRNISSLAFGGPDKRTLFITGAGEYRLHQVRLPVPGP